MQLPIAFVERMRLLLHDEFEDFLESYEKTQEQSLRVNTLKLTKEEFVRMNNWNLEEVPWTSNGFYYPAENRPGKHPWHEAGLYYIQEPSAMAVGELAKAGPGEKVLDLCAAPGGKTTHLASGMQGEGLLVSNEIHPARAKILAQNVERMGIRNAVVTNEKPADLVKHFPEFFDCIVVDAPCSGEGMFRKDPEACEHWSPDNVIMCAERQEEILESAVRMLKPGGRLIYSTCTFAPEENEGTISGLLNKYPDFYVKKVAAYKGFGPGHPEWVAQGGRPETKDTFRLWPHKLDGEGHYAAVLERMGTSGNTEEVIEKVSGNRKKGGKKAAGSLPSVDKSVLKLYDQFVKENLESRPEGVPVMFGDQLYLLPCELDLKGLKVLRAGLHVGTVKKNRLEPAHALALAVKAEEVKRTCALTSECEPGEMSSAERFLRGEALNEDGEDGWNLVLVDGYPLGWGKRSGGVLKNHYPKGLRWV